MRIRCKSRREGAAPLEAVVTISTAHGRTEEVIVHRVWSTKVVLKYITLVNKKACS